MSTRRTIRQEWQRRYIQERAMPVFAEHGYFGTTMEQVAEAAEVSKGTLYNYFAGKNDLFGSLVERGIDELFAMLDQVMDAGGSIQEVTHRLVQHFLEYFASGLGMRMMILSEREQITATHREIGPLIQARYRALIERVAGLIRLGQEQGILRPGDPVRAATVVISILSAEIHFEAMSGMNDHSTEGAEEIAACILGALGVQPGTPTSPAGEGTNS
jgi:AcrR family transcriptional regulator